MIIIILFLGNIFFYDENNILIKTIVDNGKSQDSNDINQITHRFIKNFKINLQTGLPIEISEYYLDKSCFSEKLLKKAELIYSDQRDIILFHQLVYIFLQKAVWADYYMRMNRA